MRRVALCVSVPSALIITAMCCVSGWHCQMHPNTRPDRVGPEGVGIAEFQRDLWLFAATKVRGSDRIWGAVGWNRQNLVALCEVARPIEGEDLPESYWQSIRSGTNSYFRSKLKARQAATLWFEVDTLARITHYWCFVPLWLAWSIVSAYPIIAVTKPLLVRRLRRKRGHCMACGYDLEGNVSGVCPECGTDIPPKQTATEPRRRRVLRWVKITPLLVVAAILSFGVVYESRYCVTCGRFEFRKYHAIRIPGTDVPLIHLPAKWSDRSPALLTELLDPQHDCTHSWRRSRREARPVTYEREADHCPYSYAMKLCENSEDLRDFIRQPDTLATIRKCLETGPRGAINMLVMNAKRIRRRNAQEQNYSENEFTSDERDAATRIYPD